MIGDEGGDAEGTPSRGQERGYWSWEGVSRRRGGGQARMLGSAVESLCVLKEGSSCQCVYRSEHSPVALCCLLAYLGSTVALRPRLGTHSFIH